MKTIGIIGAMSEEITYLKEKIEIVTTCAAFLRSEIQRLVTEALLADDRITAVENFKISITGKRQAAVEFTVVSVFGETEIETEVTI